ncbi:MAG: hypothetical protein AB8G77_08755 [Rhodothermales bacterium]
MSIAFPALVITILILPGILFFYTYRRGFGPSPVVLKTIQSEIVHGILCSIPINLLAIVLIDLLPFPDVDFRAVVALLTGWHGVDDAYIAQNINAISSNAGLILFYVFSTSILSALAGYLAHGIIRYYRWDLRIDYLRFSNEWRYLFSGEEYVMNILREEKENEALAMSIVAENEAEKEGQGDAANPISKVRKWRIPAAEIKAKEAEIDLHIASVVVEQGGEVYIYRGILDQYFFDKTGGLEKIVIMYPQRRRIKNDRKVTIIDGAPQIDEGFYQIDGHYFVIEYKQILNFNLYYYRYSDTSEESVGL